MRLKELNSIYKRRYSVGVALLYPSEYRASLSSLALNILYFYLNSFPEIYAERVVSDVNQGLTSIETGKPLSKFDYIFVLTSYELDYPLAASMLSRAGVGPLRTLRKEKPIVIWGGPSPTAHPLPLYHISDAVLRGEAEAFLDEVAEVLLGSDGRRQILEELSGIDSAWVPGVKEESFIARVRDLDKAFFPVRQIQSSDVEPFLGRALMVEPSRGCGRGCRFCLEGSIYGARRERSYGNLVRIIEEGLEANRLSKVAFYTLSFFDSPLGDRLLELLIERGIEGSIPSVRADSLDERRVDMVSRVGQRTLTIAPETPSERLQLLINKSIDWEKVMEVARWAKSSGMSLKLYYMYGLPGESEEDLDQIARQVESVYRVMGSKRAVKVSIVPFIPKPMTYMWKEKMMGLRELRRRERLLKEKMRTFAAVESYPPRLAVLQYEINMRGIEAAELILKLGNISPTGQISRWRGERGLEELG